MGAPIHPLQIDIVHIQNTLQGASGDVQRLVNTPTSNFQIHFEAETQKT